MTTSTDTEFCRRLEKKMDELYLDGMEKMAYHSPREDLDLWRGKLRMLREVGQLCKQIEKEMRTN